ncbi:MAG: hypothetical protein IPN75_09230 [Dechloromonas sp.]|uniref:Uncharacterized protein n=1 Tax=Candidatus Dechloromonas phosphorivorans TaxID=2899244 RepID=A0A9D7QN31_9RHOO|nr:hypothetical protein [Candidatus Dechloromonas phosphorivorans]
MPLRAAVNLDDTPIFEAAGAIFIARLANIEPDFSSLVVRRLAAVKETIRRS